MPPPQAATSVGISHVAERIRRGQQAPGLRCGVATSKTSLPSPKDLERICKGLAALDAMLMEDWESRYYSFNHAWDKKAKQRMASMRNGSGDDWFIVFEPDGVFVKAFWHEYPREDVAKIYDGLPNKLLPQLKEGAFSMEDVTFGGWHDGETWTLRGNTKPMRDELEMLIGAPAAYRAYVAAYLDVDVPADAIAHVLAGNKLDAKLVGRITTERTIAELKDDLAEIDY